MAVGTEDHLSAACKHSLANLMDNCLMRRYVNSAVLLGTGESKHMVIFIDGSAYCTERVVAVGQYIWYREFLQVLKLLLSG